MVNYLLFIISGLDVEGHICQFCGSELATKLALGRHIASKHHLENMLIKGFCTPCCDGFETAEKLIEHLKKEVRNVEEEG